MLGPFSSQGVAHWKDHIDSPCHVNVLDFSTLPGSKLPLSFSRFHIHLAQIGCSGWCWRNSDYVPLGWFFGWLGKSKTFGWWLKSVWNLKNVYIYCIKYIPLRILTQKWLFCGPGPLYRLKPRYRRVQTLLNALRRKQQKHKKNKRQASTSM